MIDNTSGPVLKSSLSTKANAADWEGQLPALLLEKYAVFECASGTTMETIGSPAEVAIFPYRELCWTCEIVTSLFVRTGRMLSLMMIEKHCDS